jgi:hypothetical protein
MRKNMLLLALISLVAYTACGGGNNGIPPLPPAPPSDGGGDKTGEPLNSTVKGKITWEGEVPKAKPISTSADPNCKNPSLVSEETVVSDGGLENVILFVSSDLSGRKFPASSDKPELSQMGCHYVPHALTLQKNQELVIKNDDDTAHNVHANSEINTQFNKAQAHKGDKDVVKFDKEEMHFPIRCDVHNWMSAFVGVFSHPLHTVSHKGGAFELKMPKGTYEITAIHEKWGTQKKMVDVPDSGSVDLNFTFKGDGKGD